MTLLTQSLPTAAIIGAALDKLKGDLLTTKDALKSAKKSRDSLLLNTSKDEAEALNATVRRLEDSIVAMTAQIKEGGKRHDATLAAEHLKGQPFLWAAMQKHLLDMDDHARAICAGAQRLAEMESKFREMCHILIRAGMPKAALGRPLNVAVKRWRDTQALGSQMSPFDKNARFAAVNLLVQSMQFPAGANYLASEVAEIMNILRAMTAKDAEQTDSIAPGEPNSNFGGTFKKAAARIAV